MKPSAGPCASFGANATFHRLTAPDARRLYRGAVRRGLLLRDLQKELARLLAAPIT
jgi:hypothetical protein